MTLRKSIGVFLVAVFLLSFVTWTIRAPVATGGDFGIKILVDALYVGGAVLAWKYLVRNKPTKKPNTSEPRNLGS